MFGIHWENLFTFTFLFCCAHKLNREKRCEISGMFWLKFLIFRFKLQCTTSLLHQIQGESKTIFCRLAYKIYYIWKSRIWNRPKFWPSSLNYIILYLSTGFVEFPYQSLIILFSIPSTLSKSTQPIQLLLHPSQKEALNFLLSIWKFQKQAEIM